VIVATLGDVISAKRVVAGVGATQVLGQMSDIDFEREYFLTTCTESTWDDKHEQCQRQKWLMWSVFRTFLGEIGRSRFCKRL
jgi:hypothetical protein